MYFEVSAAVILQLPFCLPSHTATVSAPFSHFTVGRGDPLIVHKNLALEPSITACGDCIWPDTLAGEGSGN